MKILVYSDVHGSERGMEAALQAVAREKPQKVVCCGDLFGETSDKQIAEMAQSVDATQYFVRGNNDRIDGEHLINGGMEEGIPMFHFGRTLYFTHGDRYNGWRIPPFLRQNDAIIFGHTHVGSLVLRDGLFVLNVGSVARPRDDTPCYLVLDELGATLKNLDGSSIFLLQWR